MTPRRQTATVTALSVLLFAVPVLSQDSIRTRITATAFIVGPTETVAIFVRYSRPPAAGRTVLGDIIPFDRPWLTGIEVPADVTCQRPFMIGSLKVPAGTYSLWTLPTRTGVTLIVSKQFGHDAAKYDAREDVGRVPLSVDSLPTAVEPFTIAFRSERKAPDTLVVQYDVKQSAAMHGEHQTMGVGTGTVQSLVITWDRFRWALPVRLQ